MHSRIDKMKKHSALYWGIVLLLSLCAPRATAQIVVNAKPGIQHVQGVVFLDGKPLELAHDIFIQIRNSQVLSTKKGYVELIVGPTAYLRLGEDASLRMLNDRFDNIQVELNNGSTLIEIIDGMKVNPIIVHIAQRVIAIERTGLYRFDSVPGMLRTYGGEALIKNKNRSIHVKNGKMVFLDDKCVPKKFNTNDADDLHRWAAQRSFDIYSAYLLTSNPGYGAQRYWAPKQNNYTNSYYRLSFPANENWTRYWENQYEKTRAMGIDMRPSPVLNSTNLESSEKKVANELEWQLIELQRQAQKKRWRREALLKEVETQPYTQWSVMHVGALLWDSPWAKPSSTNEEEAYRVRLLTARPVREAILRNISLTTTGDARITQADNGNTEAEKARLNEFMISHQTSPIVKGDDAHIIVSLQGPNLDKLSEKEFSNLIVNASLTTDTGKRVKIIDSVLPESDGFGIKLYFNRIQPDGTFLISGDDKELLFKTQLGNQKIAATFKLKKMQYKGKLEY
jgi:hypothetical protein